MISPESNDFTTEPDDADSEVDPSEVGPSEEGPSEIDLSEMGSVAPAETEEIDALAEAQRRALRLQAELENYRKRTQRMMEEERRYCSLTLLRDLLEVVDNLERAASAADQDETSSGLLEGVKMVATQFKAVLQKHHCEPIEAEGQPFDPNCHEAIAQFPSESHEPGTVSNVHKIGYRLYQRVVRPSQVIVAAPAQSAQPTSDEDDDEAAETID